MRIAVIGDEGGGKSLGLVTFGSLALDAYNMPLGANFPVLLPGAQFIQTKQQLYAFERGVMLYDEMWFDVDSRRSSENVELTRWVRQTRKKKLLLFYTTQDFGQVDKRVRSGTRLIMHCEARRNDSFRYRFYGVDSFGSIRPLRRFDLIRPDLFWHLYDSDRMVDLLE